MLTVCMLFGVYGSHSWESQGCACWVRRPRPPRVCRGLVTRRERGRETAVERAKSWARSAKPRRAQTSKTPPPTHNDSVILAVFKFNTCIPTTFHLPSDTMLFGFTDSDPSVYLSCVHGYIHTSTVNFRTHFHCSDQQRRLWEWWWAGCFVNETNVKLRIGFKVFIGLTVVTAFWVAPVPARYTKFKT